MPYLFVYSIFISLTDIKYSPMQISVKILELQNFGHPKNCCNYPKILIKGLIIELCVRKERQPVSVRKLRIITVQEIPLKTSGSRNVRYRLTENLKQAIFFIGLWYTENYAQPNIG